LLQLHFLFRTKTPKIVATIHVLLAQINQNAFATRVPPREGGIGVPRQNPCRDIPDPLAGFKGAASWQRENGNKEVRGGEGKEEK